MAKKRKASEDELTGAVMFAVLGGPSSRQVEARRWRKADRRPLEAAESDRAETTEAQAGGAEARMIPEVYESVKARLELAQSMVAALKADAFDEPATRKLSPIGKRKLRTAWPNSLR